MVYIVRSGEGCFAALSVLVLKNMKLLIDNLVFNKQEKVINSKGRCVCLGCKNGNNILYT